MADALSPTNSSGSDAATQAGTSLSPSIGTDQPSGFQAQLAGFFAQPAVRKSLPALAGLGSLAAVGALYMSIAGGPERVLYSSLSDGERAQVVETLEAGGISYSIDPGTGMVTVSEDDVYRARMLVASDGGLAAPETGGDILNAIPMGASRTLEGERMRLARERELNLTIMEIDGIEAVRVHLATPERSVFVRDKAAPSASVMVRLAKGRSLETSQTNAIVNLVSGSVPSLAASAVRVIDQHGALLSEKGDGSGEGLDLQARYEAKLQSQLAGLLSPMLGEGNFSSEVQVELDSTENTSARESYDPESVVRSESEARATRSNPAQVGGVPGVLANTPPPPNELADEAPQGDNGGDNGADQAETAQGDTEESSQRNYAIGREVSVTSNAPGSVTRLSVAVAVSEEALAAIAPADEAKIQSLVEAAVGANADRGDTVTVIVGKFDPVTIEPMPFYETAWFAMALRYSAALIAVLLGLLLGVRPILKALRGEDAGASKKDKKKKGGKDGDEEDSDDETADGDDADAEDEDGALAANSDDPSDKAIRDGGTINGEAAPANLEDQIALARQLALEQPDRAVSTLQRMLAAPQNGPQNGPQTGDPA